MSNEVIEGFECAAKKKLIAKQKEMKKLADRIISIVNP